MAKKKFQAVLERPEGVGTWTYLTVPSNIAEEYGSHAQVRVTGTINGLPYRSTLLPRGDGTHFMVVNKTLRDKINAIHGDAVRVAMERDEKPRTVSLPNDFKRALGRNNKAQAAFEKVAYSHKKRYLEWIAGAKQAETRKRRIEQAMTRLAQNGRSKL